MILVDTSVWIHHFRKGNVQVFCHPFIAGELACATLRNRHEVLSLLSTLPQARLLEHDEVLHFLEARHLYGCGLGWIDTHLLASALLTGCRLWTKNKDTSSRIAMMTITRIVVAVFVAAAAPVFAQESERVRQLQQDVDVLNSTVREQNRRIEALERVLSRGCPPSRQPSRMRHRPKKYRRPATLARWKVMGSVKKGMSEAQVISILGPPTSVDAVGGFKTYFTGVKLAGRAQ